MELVRNISDAKLMFCNVQELVNSYTIQFLVEFTDNISIRKVEDTINKLQWNVITIDNYIPNIVAKISKILQKYFINDNVKFMIPVDLRNYDRTTKRIGNLILPIYIDVGIDDDINKIGGKLLLSLKDRKELNMYSAKKYNYHIYPEKVRRFVIKKFFNYLRNKNRYFVVAIVSHLGRLSFNSSYKFSIENNHRPLIPFSTVITEYKNKTNITICGYKNQILKDMEGVE